MIELFPSSFDIEMLMAELLSEYFIALDIRLDIERRNIILSANISLLVFATLNVRLFSSAKYIKKSKIEESSFSESKNSLFAEIKPLSDPPGVRIVVA